MASTDVKLPDIGEGVKEGELVRWLVKEGDVVKHDQPLVEVMTDKATVEIPCSSDGKVTKLVAKEGQIVKVGETLLTLESGASKDVKSEAPRPQAAAPGPAKTAPAPMAAASATPSKAPAAPVMSGGRSMDMYPPAAESHVLATPATRRYAREAGVDINNLKGSGPLGRVTRNDVASATQGVGAVAAAKPQYRPPMKSQASGSQSEERKPFRGIRRKIAENLVRSKQTIPHFTHVDEADVTELVQWRAKLKEKALAQGVKLTYLPLIMKALVITAREFPNFNSSLDDQASELVIKHYYNVGFAADTPEGLLVPNVKNVEDKSVMQLAFEIQELADKARSGKLSPDDMRHGTMTITNIGSIGGTYATPIINHPEVVIFGIYKIQKKPVVVNNEIKIREMMGLTATCDHRVVDGAQAAQFLNKLIYRLENPESLILEMS